MVEAHLNFFLIGAPKSGTTLIHERLGLHPQVFLSPLKEPNYYATDIDTRTFSAAFRANHTMDVADYLARKPLAPRQIGFIRQAEAYAALFEAVGPQHTVVGECSTSYLWSRDAAGHVATAHPGARVLAVLRNPVDRLFSHWLMARKYGFTNLGLREAVEEDLAHPHPGWGRSELFVEAGRYAAQLERWRHRFPEGRVKVLFTESLAQEGTWRDLGNWLGLEGAIPPAGEGKVNVAGLARWEGVNHWMTSSGIKPAAARWVPRILKTGMKRLWYTGSDLPTLTTDDRHYLFGHFEDDIIALEKMLEVDLAHWRP